MTNPADVEILDYFVAGGTLRPNTPSYVQRPADDELFNLALNGEFCYVLTSRQMGKSSLMIRTARRLRAEGAHSVIIDLTKVGIEVNVEQWYLGLLTQLKRKLHLSVDLETWWAERNSLGNVQRFSDFLHDVLLKEVEGRVVIFMDEIDTTLNLAFSDDFFAAIRYVFNARATDSDYDRITFILLGVATPADLIKDRSRTPFNIGQGIDLNDFSRADTKVLAEGLQSAYPEQGEAIFNRVFYWTHGHPYLTQKLCLSVAETHNGAWTDDKVDELVERLFLSKEARKETNLQFVRDYVQASPQRRRLLKVYRQVYKGKSVTEDERSIDQNQLKLFGLVRVEDNLLKVRNEIYRHVFNLDWVKVNTPVDWTRRIAIIAGLIIVVLIGMIFGSFYWQEQRAISDQAKVHIDAFRSSNSPDVRVTSLAGLYDLPGFADQANQLFYDELTPEERLVLFASADSTAVGSQIITVVKGLYTGLENNERDNALLQTMSEPLAKLDDSRAANLSVEIKQWLQARNYYANNQYDRAVGVYDVVISLNDRNPGTVFDRGVAYVALGQPEHALADFETVLTLDESRKNRVEQVVINTPVLYDLAVTQDQNYPAVMALVPSPTSTPTNTSTPTSTPTNTPTPTETSTPTPTLTPLPPTATLEPTVTNTVEVAVVVATSTPIPTDTPIPTPTFTPTPQPATIIYVQSNFQTHNLGIVSSAGQVLNEGIHQRAAAPTWSPDGKFIAFYGEEGISELGGIYAQGNGVWITDMSTGSASLLFPIVHITNMTWSPDGRRIAMEVGPPGVIHRIVVIDASSGEELSRFPGEQPTWSPDSQELIIKSCAPECGLWRVGFDGGGGRLTTRDSTDSYPAWSSDGRYLAFTSRFRDGDWEIYRLELETDELLRLTNRPGTDTTPVFSPDGLEIYLRTDAFGPWRIMAMPVDGSAERIIKDTIGISDDWGLARPAVN